VVRVSRAKNTLTFPACFTLIAAMNPCPCGWFTDPKKECHCSPNQIHKYLSKISGPLLDRIDLHLDVPALKSVEILTSQKTETSQEIKSRTIKARHIQHKRFSAPPRITTDGGKRNAIFANAQMNHRQIKEFCPLDSESKSLLKKAIEELNLSARAYDKILKIARTIADLEETERIRPHHIAEAIQYRSLDRNWW